MAHQLGSEAGQPQFGLTGEAVHGDESLRVSAFELRHPHRPPGRIDTFHRNAEARPGDTDLGELEDMAGLGSIGGHPHRGVDSAGVTT